MGGYGTRLWPLSRKSFPKQFLPLDNDDEKSLLQKTQTRILGLKDLTDPILVCNTEHRFIVAEQMRDIKIKPKSILLEPFGRSTAPAIIFAALKSLETESDPHLLILSADHLIKNEKKFRDLIEIGKDYSKNDQLVNFGIVPNSPETGYGYIRSEKPFDLDKIEGLRISEFIEKPNLTKAKELIKDSLYTWNSGIFLFKAKTIIEEIKEFNLDIFKVCSEALIKSEKDLDFQRINKEIFEKCPDISIDVAIMEKTKKGIVLPLDANWSDIGSWKSLWESSNKDNLGNVKKGKVISNRTENCYLHSEKKLLVSLGIHDLVIIDTEDVTLVAAKNESEKIKKVVSDLKNKNIKEAITHKKVIDHGDIIFQ